MNFYRNNSIEKKLSLGYFQGCFLDWVWQNGSHSIQLHGSSGEVATDSHCFAATLDVATKMNDYQLNLKSQPNITQNVNYCNLT